MQHEGEHALDVRGAAARRRTGVPATPVSVTTSWRAVALIAVLASVACKSLQRAKPTKTGFLGDYSRLQEVDGEYEPELLYVESGADWTSYTAVQLDRVTMWRGKDDQPEIPEEDAQSVVNNFHKLIQESLTKDFDLVDQPAANTLRIEVAVTHVSSASEFMNVVTSMEPHTHLIGALEEYAGAKPPFTGEAQIELRVTDAVSGAMLMESVDRRVGRRQLVGSWDSWHAVDQAMEFWATQLRYMLCRQRGKSDCEPPVQAKGF